MPVRSGVYDIQLSSPRKVSIDLPGAGVRSYPAPSAPPAPPPAQLPSVDTIRTLQRALCETELGTLPSTRLAPCMPWLPTTIRLAPVSAATATSASAGLARTAWVCTATPSSPAEACASASVAATASSSSSVGIDHEPARAGGRDASHRVVRADHVNLGAERLRQPHGLGHRALGGGGPVGPDHDRLAHCRLLGVWCGARRRALYAERLLSRVRPALAGGRAGGGHPMITAEEIGAVPAFAALDAEGRERLAHVAADLSLVAGEYAANEGDERALFAVISGAIEAVKLVDGIDRVLGSRAPGDLFGEVPITLGTVFPVGFRAARPRASCGSSRRTTTRSRRSSPRSPKEVGRMAGERISGPRGLAGIAAEPPPPRAIVVGGHFDPATTELRRFLDRNQVSHHWLDPQEPDAQVQWDGPLPGPGDRPVIRVIGGRTVLRPSLRASPSWSA